MLSSGAGEKPWVHGVCLRVQPLVPGVMSWCFHLQGSLRQLHCPGGPSLLRRGPADVPGCREVMPGLGEGAG